MEYASFGAALHRRRCYFLSELDAHHVLLLGDGDGRFLAEFVRRYPSVRIDVLDCSRRMLALAAHRAPACDRIHFHHSDAVRDPLPGRDYDLIVTHFFLDCFTPTELCDLVAKISAAAAPNARWILSEFHLPPAGWRRLRAKLWIGSLYFAFRVLTGLRARALPDYVAALRLRSQGFERRTQDLASAGLLTSELWKRG